MVPPIILFDLAELSRLPQIWGTKDFRNLERSPLPLKLTSDAPDFLSGKQITPTS